MVRMLAWALGTAAALTVIGLGSVYAMSEWKMRRTYDAPLEPLRAVTADPVAGRHMARIVGCWAGWRWPPANGASPPSSWIGPCPAGAGCQ